MKTIKPNKKTKKELRYIKRKIIIVSFLIITIFVVFVSLMNNERFKLSKISISGNKVILENDIRQVVNNNLNNKILWFFPLDNILLINTKKIKQDIENTFPNIYNTKVFINDGSKLIIEVDERKPHSLWCKKVDYITNFNEECYFADQKAYIYAKAPYFSDGVFEKIYTNSELLKIGKHILKEEDFNIFFRFIDLLYNSFDININRIFIDNSETVIYINSLIKTNFIHKPYIIYNNTDSYEIIIRNINLMLDNELFKKEFKKYPNRLEFIDLRIIDQIRYKFTTENELLERQKEETGNKKNEKKENTNE